MIPTSFTAVIKLGRPVEYSTIEAVQGKPSPVPAAQLARSVIITTGFLNGIIGYQTTHGDSGVLRYTPTPTVEAACPSS